MEEGRGREGERRMNSGKRDPLSKNLDFDQKRTRGGLNQEGQQDTILKIGVQILNFELAIGNELEHGIGPRSEGLKIDTHPQPPPNHWHQPNRQIHAQTSRIGGYTR